VNGVSLAFTTCLTIVFATAALGKLAGGNRRWMNATIACIELGVCALLAFPDSVIIGAFAALVLAAAFVVRVVWVGPGRPCSCLGDKLPTTSWRGQFIRNSGLLGAAALNVVATGTSGLTWNPAPMGSVLVGLAAGLALVAGPWIAQPRRAS
jgi:hypothetical protein